MPESLIRLSDCMLLVSFLPVPLFKSAGQYTFSTVVTLFVSPSRPYRLRVTQTLGAEISSFLSLETRAQNTSLSSLPSCDLSPPAPIRWETPSLICYSFIFLPLYQHTHTHLNYTISRAWVPPEEAIHPMLTVFIIRGEGKRQD